MGQEIKEQLKGIVNLPTIAGDALKHIEAQEKELEKVYSDLGEEESKNDKLESRISDLEGDLERAEEMDEEIATNSVQDEMRKKILIRFYQNLTLTQLDDLEAHVKQNIVKGNYKDF